MNLLRYLTALLLLLPMAVGFVVGLLVTPFLSGFQMANEYYVWIRDNNR